MGNRSGAEGTSEGGHRDTHLWETSRQDRRVHEVYDRLTRIAKEANSGRGDAEFVSVPEEPYEGNPHVRFCEGGSRSYDLYPSTRPRTALIYFGLHHAPVPLSECVLSSRHTAFHFNTPQGRPILSGA